MFWLLAAQSVPAPPSDFIRDHSTFVAWLIALLLIVVFIQFGAGFGWIRGELLAGKKRFEELNERLNSHMEAEEINVWKAMQDMQKQLADMAVENTQAHSDILQGRVDIFQRMATVEAELRSLKSVEIEIRALKSMIENRRAV